MRRSSLRLSLLSALVLGLLACGGGGDGGEDTDDGDDHGHTASGAVCPPGSTLTYQGFGAPFMQSYCTSCHRTGLSGSARMGAPVDHNYETREGVLLWRADIDSHAAAGPAAVNTLMPPSLPRPTPLEREQLGQWLACGAP